MQKETSTTSTASTSVTPTSVTPTSTSAKACSSFHPHKSTLSPIELNVGGTIFTTMPSTLKGSGLFSTMLQSDVPTARDRQGRIFIDRDGAQFHRVLEFLRTGFIDTDEDQASLRKEADFYQIVPLLKLLDREANTSGIVRLNVGGTPFTTSIGTLRGTGSGVSQYSMLWMILELVSGGESQTMIRDETGAIFIDREPTMFPYVLHFARTGRFRMLTSGSSTELIDEFVFYFGYNSPVANRARTVYGDV